MRDLTSSQEVTAKDASSPLTSPLIIPSLSIASATNQPSSSSSPTARILPSPPNSSRPPIPKRRSTAETIQKSSFSDGADIPSNQTTGTTDVAGGGGGGLTGIVRKLSGKSGGGGKLVNALRMGGFKLGKGGGGGEEKGGREKVENEDEGCEDEGKPSQPRDVPHGPSSSDQDPPPSQTETRPIPTTDISHSPPPPSATFLSPISSTHFSIDHFSQTTLVPQFRLHPTSPGSTSFEGDLTPRAEVPPDLVGRGGVGIGGTGSEGPELRDSEKDSSGRTTIGRKTAKACSGDPGQIDNLDIQRVNDNPHDGPSKAASKQKSRSPPPPTPGSPPQPDSYFPDLDTALRRIQLQANSTGPKAIESPSGSEGTTPGGELTPWPSSKKHGGTPIGAGAAAAMEASGTTDLSATTSSLGDPGRKDLEEVLTPSGSSFAPIGAQTDAELVAAGTGFMVSTPLSPPPGYPFGSPIARTASKSAPASRDGTPISERGEHGPRHSSFGVFSGVTAAWKDAVEGRRLAEGAGIGVDGKDMSPTGSGGTGSDPSSVSGSPSSSSLDQGPLDGALPYEGKITIDTEETRYVITAELEGFKLENITIAVKSVSVSTSGSGGSGSGSGKAKLSDAASMHSFASGTSVASSASMGPPAAAAATTAANNTSNSAQGLSRSQHRARRLADDPYATHGAIGGDIGGLQDLGATVDLAARRASIASTSSSVHSQSGLVRDQRRSSQQVERRKVVHLVADRWEDSAHFERRITFGADADLSGGVKAKFDGKQLAIVVPRQPKKHSHNPLRKSSTSETTPASTSISPNSNSPILSGHRGSIASSGSGGSRNGSTSSVIGSSMNGNIILEGICASPEDGAGDGQVEVGHRGREETVTDNRRGEWREEMMAVGGDVHPRYAMMGNSRSRTKTG